MLPKAGVDAGVPKSGVDGCPKACKSQRVRYMGSRLPGGTPPRRDKVHTGVAVAPNIPPDVWPNGALAGCRQGSKIRINIHLGLD